MKLIKHHWELDVYKLSVETSMEIFRLSKKFPKEEIYSLTDQIRRSSRAVSAMTAEAWRRRKYEAAFVNKLNEAEEEAAETQTWIESL
jgi:four helix bundle protein